MIDTELYHLTLNTGHVVRGPRSQVDQKIIDLLLPIIDAEQGMIPSMPGWYIDLIFPLSEQHTRLDGGAYFQIARTPGLSNAPLIQAIVVWKAEMADGAWRQLMAGYGAIQRLTHKVAPAVSLPAPDQPPGSLPWLAVWINPVLLNTSSEDMKLFGDFERCVAWTIIEAGT